jgi:hypothetical protein
MTAGRPPKPVELKRATGNPGKRKLPDLSIVSIIPMAMETPAAPEGLGEEGNLLWTRAWDSAITWLSPASDRNAIENAARLADTLAAARAKYHATLDAADLRALVQINKSYTDSLSALGFDPVSRSKLGVAEVKRVSALDQLLAKRQNR